MNARKFGWTEKGVVGFIFTPLGGMFLTLGLLLGYLIPWETAEDRLIFTGIFCGMGGTFLAVGLILLALDMRRQAALRRAVESGDYVMAKIAGVQKRMNVNAAGVSPCVVECHYQEPGTGATHVFFSRYLYFDPTDMLTGQEVPVYLDRMNEKIAYVDIDAVLPKVILHR